MKDAIGHTGGPEKQRHREMQKYKAKMRKLTAPSQSQSVKKKIGAYTKETNMSYESQKNSHSLEEFFEDEEENGKEEKED